MSTETTKLFADRLLDLISDSKAKLKEIEKDTGITAATLSKYQNDKAEASITNLSKLANYFHVTTEYLLGRYDNMTLENAKIGYELGLSDGAIDVLHKLTLIDYKSFLIKTINYLIEQEKGEVYSNFMTQIVEDGKPIVYNPIISQIERYFSTGNPDKSTERYDEFPNYKESGSIINDYIETVFGIKNSNLIERYLLDDICDKLKQARGQYNG